jgi:hypothetical protein
MLSTSVEQVRRKERGFNDQTRDAFPGIMQIIEGKLGKWIHIHLFSSQLRFTLVNLIDREWDLA